MRSWYYTITQSMLELGLRGTELNLYAVIHGYSQKGDGCYYGTRNELCERCGVSSVRTIDSALASLIKKGLIQKMVIEKNGTPLVAYGCADSARGGVQILHGGVGNNCTGGCANSAPMNNKDRNIKGKDKGDFVAPTPDEVRDYANSINYYSLDAEHFVEYYDATGWCVRTKSGQMKPMENWKLAVQTWKQRDKAKGTDISKPQAAPATAPADNGKYGIKFDGML